MRLKILVACLVSAILFYSCSFSYWGYIRNATSNTATIEVTLLDASLRNNLAPHIRTAGKAIAFKRGHRRLFTDSTAIEWMDSAHFRVIVQPQTTIDLEDIAGHFFSASFNTDIRVIVMTPYMTDTLINGKDDLRREKFTYRSNGFPPRPFFYYDIRQHETTNTLTSIW